MDESSTLGAADYERMLSELSKYGASFVLVTQSLAKLDAIDRALRPTVFSNIDGLTVFQVSAEDARYLAPELGGDIQVEDMTDLNDFECYARWWADGQRLPAFSLRLDPPPRGDPDRVAAIARRSAERFGRPRDEVAKEIDKVLAERGGLDGPPGVPQPANGDDGNQESIEGTEGELKPTGRTNAQVPARSQNRDRRRR